MLIIPVPPLLPFLLFYFVLPQPSDPIMAIYHLWFTEPQGLLKGKEEKFSDNACGIYALEHLPERCQRG